MEIGGFRPLLPSLQDSTGTQLRRFLAGLLPGQILQAQVAARNRDSLVALNIGSHKLVAKTALQLEPGQRLTLEVTRTVGSMPELRLLEPATAAQLTRRALRATLPYQTSPAQLFEQLTMLQKLQPAPIPLQIDRLIRRLLAVAIPFDSPRLARDLQRRFANSGLFLESLLSISSPPDFDLKADLLRLMQLLKTHHPDPGPDARSEQPTPANPDQSRVSGGRGPMFEELAQRVAAGIARVRLNQLASLPDAQEQTQVWQFDIPIQTGRGVDPVQITIQQERKTPVDRDGADWHVTLRMELQELGPLQARLSLSSTERITTRFWAQQAATRDRIAQALPHLERALSNAGLVVQSMAVHQGLPEPMPVPDQGAPLLDEQA